MAGGVILFRIEVRGAQRANGDTYFTAVAQEELVDEGNTVGWKEVAWSSGKAPWDAASNAAIVAANMEYVGRRG